MIFGPVDTLGNIVRNILDFGRSDIRPNKNGRKVDDCFDMLSLLKHLRVITENDLIMSRPNPAVWIGGEKSFSVVDDLTPLGVFPHESTESSRVCRWIHTWPPRGWGAAASGANGRPAAVHGGDLAGPGWCFQQSRSSPSCGGLGGVLELDEFRHRLSYRHR